MKREVCGTKHMMQCTLFRFPVSSLDCSVPRLSLDNVTEDVTSAPEHYKAFPLIISVDVDIVCGVTLRNSKAWVVTRVNEESGETISTVDISSLPSRYVVVTRVNEESGETISTVDISSLPSRYVVVTRVNEESGETISTVDISSLPSRYVVVLQFVAIMTSELNISQQLLLL